ncbi:MAG: hypothetical protein GXP31_05190 [Kiritimatiellaeota bacterium]|nr:hypothetical protein [Kiritimatiellota bacterium]
MRTDVLALAAVLSVSAAIRGAPPPVATSASAWRVPDADFRILVAPAAPKSHTLRVDLPEEFSATNAAVAAFTTDGKPVAARPIQFQGRTVGVELHISRHTAGAAYRQARSTRRPPLSVELYLTRAGKPPTPAATLPPPVGRTPVALTRRLARYRTRPFLGREMLRLEAVAKTGFRYTIWTPGITPELPYDKWASPPERYTAVLHWETELRLEKKAAVRFGAGALNTAWFLFVDDAFIVGWKEGLPPDKGTRFSRPLDLAPGFHRLDFFVYQRSGENIPALSWQQGDTPPAALQSERLFPTRRPPALRIERRKKALHPGLEIRQLERWVFTQTGANALALNAVGRGRSYSRGAIRSQALAAGGRNAVGLPVSCMLFPGCKLPSLTLTAQDEAGARATVSLPGHTIWGPVRLAAPVLELRNLPAVLPPDAPLTASCAVLDVPPPLAPAFARSDAVRWETRDSSDQPLSSGTVPLESPDHGIRSLRVPLGGARLLVLHLEAGGAVPAVRPVIVELLRPDRPVPPLILRGNRLFADGVPAVLRPLANPANREQPRGVHSPSRSTRLAVVDDFWAVASAPDALVRPETGLTELLGVPVDYYGVDSPDLVGSVRRLRKFALLAPATAKQGSAVLWAVGAADLKAGRRPVELCLDLLFLAEAVQAAGCTPVLCTLPPIPGVEPATIREAALLIKELAFKLRVPVVDFYSKALLDYPGSTRNFSSTFRTFDGRIGLRTPNDRTRIWLTRVTADTLKSVFATASDTNESLKR